MRAGACPTNKKIVPRPCQKTAVFSIQNTCKRFQHFIRVVGSSCSLALIYLVVSVLRALDEAGEWWLPGGELPPASGGGIVGPEVGLDPAPSRLFHVGFSSPGAVAKLADLSRS